MVAPIEFCKIRSWLSQICQPCPLVLEARQGDRPAQWGGRFYLYTFEVLRQ
jgi:hypothetical protein